ncbi:hypothetical protein LXA43DRAFT_1105740 [Ganoderma leucocontextum]|nr:hypothetical protein LXA43DRAFT_1105740 [Ganoderma leucocontextum]
MAGALRSTTTACLLLATSSATTAEGTKPISSSTKRVTMDSLARVTSPVHMVVAALKTNPASRQCLRDQDHHPESKANRTRARDREDRNRVRQREHNCFTRRLVAHPDPPDGQGADSERKGHGYEPATNPVATPHRPSPLDDRACERFVLPAPTSPSPTATSFDLAPHAPGPCRGRRIPVHSVVLRHSPAMRESLVTPTSTSPSSVLAMPEVASRISSPPPFTAALPNAWVSSLSPHPPSPRCPSPSRCLPHEGLIVHSSPSLFLPSSATYTIGQLLLRVPARPAMLRRRSAIPEPHVAHHHRPVLAAALPCTRVSSRLSRGAALLLPCRPVVCANAFAPHPWH